MSENKPGFYLALNAVRAPRRPRRSAAGALGVVHRPADAEAEFEGFTEAKIILTEELDDTTRYTVAYIQRIHQLTLGHLYTFAGKWGDVNLYKGGFSFAASCRGRWITLSLRSVPGHSPPNKQTSAAVQYVSGQYVLDRWRSDSRRGPALRAEPQWTRVYRTNRVPSNSSEIILHGELHLLHEHGLKGIQVILFVEKQCGLFVVDRINATVR